jgi:hypothetical protein
MISLQETEVKRILNFFEESGRIKKNPLSHCCAMTALPKGELFTAFYGALLHGERGSASYRA